MRISSKSHYAVRAMVELAMAYNRGNLQLKIISKRQNLSQKYLEQIFILLRAKGLVDSQRGYSGGFILSRSPQKITVYDILETMEDTLSPVECIDHPETCDRQSFCATRKVWLRIRNCIEEELKSVNLASLAEEQIKKDQRTMQVYNYQI
jgi:Rrf2 family transcriptional regulator, cysteine metabolism repressor